MRREVLVKHQAIPITILHKLARHHRDDGDGDGNDDDDDDDVTYASLVSGMSSPHWGLGFFIISSVT